MYCYGVVYKLAEDSLQSVALVYFTKDNPLQLTRMYIITLMCFCVFGSDLNDLEPHFFPTLHLWVASLVKSIQCSY